MIGTVLIGSAAAVALAFAAAARLRSLTATLLVGYLVFVADLGCVTLALSPFRAVTRPGLEGAQAGLLVASLAVWWLRGRPGLPHSGAAAAAREFLADPVCVLFALVVLGLLGYELLLGLTVPPNNMDSLTYHLTRVAAWAEHGGIYWIPNAPEVELNAYQPLAEQQNLFLFVASGGGALFALPQYLAELAILGSIYGGSRRLGFDVRRAACAACLFATFSTLALEATTAQNDVVAASFPAVAACLLLGSSGIEAAFAGAAIAFGLGTKLTTGLVLPVLVWLALTRGRRVCTVALAGGLAGLAAPAMWGYVLNVVHTGDLLGAGTAYVQDRASPGYPRSVANVFYLLYGTMDLSVLSNRLIDGLALVGALVVVAAGLLALRRRDTLRRGIAEATSLATPFLAPAVVLLGAAALALVAGWWGFPIRGPHGILAPVDANLNEVYTRFANEDYSAFGPLGIVALLAAAALALRASLGRRGDARQLALAAAFPLFLVLLALQISWVPFMTRFFLIPAVLTAPLLARLFRNRAVTTAYLAVGALVIGLTITHDQSKPLASVYGRPWHYGEFQALYVNSDRWAADSLTAYNELVPAKACVGAILDPNEPTYLLYGPQLEHHIVYLSVDDPVLPALRDGLFYVVISAGPDRWVAGEFRRAGWHVRPLGTVWLLASEPRGGSGACTV